MKTRKERERELQKLAVTEHGKLELLRLYRELHHIAEGQSPETGTLIIQGILSKEYPDEGK